MQCLHLLSFLWLCKIKICISGEHSFPMHDYNMYRRGANICTFTRSSCIWSLHCRVDRQNLTPSIVSLNLFYRKQVAFCTDMSHYGIYPILDKHGGQRIKVGRRVIQMLFPMNQMANNDRQSACLIFGKALAHPAYYMSYDYRTEPPQEERIKAWSGKWSFERAQVGELHTKAAEEFFLPGFEQLFDKTSTQCILQVRGWCFEKRQMPCYSPAPAKGTVDTFHMHITRIKSLSRFHHCSDGLSSYKTPFLLRTRMCKYFFQGWRKSANDIWRSNQRCKSKSRCTGEKWPVLLYRSKLSFRIPDSSYYLRDH